MTPITALRAATAAAEQDFQQEVLRQTSQLAEALAHPDFNVTALPQLLKNFERRSEPAKRRLEEYRNRLRKLTEPSASKKKTGFLDFLRSEEVQNKLKLGIYTFFPIVIPLGITGKSVSDYLDLPGTFQNLGASLAQSLKESRETKQRFFAKLEGAVHNPASVEDFQKSNLFVLDESGFHRLLKGMVEKGCGEKLRNLSVEFDGDVLKIKGECKAKFLWVDFRAQLEFEIDEGKSSGRLFKVKAAGMDLSSFFQGEILQAFRKFDIHVPEGAALKDLSWVRIPGIKRVEMKYNRLIIERHPSPTGPS